MTEQAGRLDQQHQRHDDEDHRVGGGRIEHLGQALDQAQAKALSIFARYLGKVMPIWYSLSLALLIAEACLRRHQPALTPLLTAIIIWIAVILYTVTTLVPINNRIVALSTRWRSEHKRWDTLHRWRILLLTIAMICVIHALLKSPVI